MAMISIKPEIFLGSTFRGANIQRPRRMTRPSNFIESGNLDPELTMAIQESLKIARQDEIRKTFMVNDSTNRMIPSKITPKSPVENRKLFPSRETTAAHSQTDLFSPEATEQLKKLSKTNLDLVKHQQELLNAKDKEIKSLRSENEALQCRLERMERRMSILKHKDDVSPSVVSPHHTPLATPLKRKLSSPPPETFCKRLAAETCRLLNKPETPLNKRAKTKQSTQTSESQHNTSNRSRKVQGNTEELTVLTSTEEYHVLPCSAILRSPTLDGPASRDFTLYDEVEVPSWNVQVFKNIYQMEGTENMTDEAYMRRHQKPEMEEKRRKRWDLQRQREQEAYERLREKAYGVVQVECTDEHSLYPVLNSISHIEICDDIPVSVFGRAVPSISQTSIRPVLASSHHGTTTDL